MQDYFCLSDEFGWPLPINALNSLLADLTRELLTILDGGRAILTPSGLAVSSAEAFCGRVSSTLDTEEGVMVVQKYLQSQSNFNALSAELIERIRQLAKQELEQVVCVTP